MAGGANCVVLGPKPFTGVGVLRLNILEKLTVSVVADGGGRTASVSREAASAMPGTGGIELALLKELWLVVPTG